MDFVQGKRKTPITGWSAQHFSDVVSWLLSYFVPADEPPALWNETDSGRLTCTFPDLGNVGVSGWIIDDRLDLTISVDTGNQFGSGFLHTLYVIRGPNMARLEIVDVLFAEPDEERGIRFAKSSYLGLDALLALLRKIGE